jgi:hypothetical protein
LEDPSTAWLVPPTQKIPLAENRFLQAGKGAENTKEKSRQCFTFTVRQLLQFLGIFFPKHMKLLAEYSFYKYFSQNDENSSPKKSLLRVWHPKRHLKS